MTLGTLGEIKIKHLIITLQKIKTHPIDVNINSQPLLYIILQNYDLKIKL